ncbi:tetratricopeptide repeat protein [Foetidibacter luteolus]|uniref:tetratricopeptide repeat protein n=1 Tax=Foetidibacter luteolus TaxID=2608880 RepID=UPI00129B9C60|nr:tetratricopeptide repeat protein [Foetidibacter luteolus]
MKHLVLFLFCITTVLYSRAQDELKPGFKMLENGKFDDAALFFRKYLDTQDSANRTALLCYGRAIGLSGQVPQAKKVFENLLEKYPGDFEISLNAAEALMWGKEYALAKTWYERLLLEKPTDFAANLGYANALCSLHDYAKGLEYIDKALNIQPGNTNALISGKYARLGLADSYAKNQQYMKAAILLEDVLHTFNNDREALFAKAQLKIMLEQFEEAQKINNDLLEITKGQTEVYLNLSYISFLRKNKKLALVYADKAIASTVTQPEKYLKARLGRITALGWNEKFKQAFAELDSLQRQFPESNDVLLKRAGLLTWNKEYGRSAGLFKQALAEQPSSFDGNLGCADALFAQELDDESKKYVLKTLDYYPNQKDAKDFLSRLSLRHAPAFSTHDFYSSDKGGNSSRNYQVAGSTDLITNVRLTAEYKRREAKSAADKSYAHSESFGLSLRWRFKPYWLISGTLSNAVLKGLTDNHNHLLADVASEFKLTKNQSLELRYQTNVENFTAGLIDNNLKLKHMIATYNLNTDIKLGLYSQYYHTVYSDGNSRNLLFASLYYNVMAAPVVKFGFNYSSMGFKKQVPQVYFSPSKFSGYELFGLVENLQVPRQKILYQLLGAAGTQRIEQEGGQSTYRFTIAAGYRPATNVEALAYTLYSNSATSSVVGYTYQETGIKVKWILAKKY